MGLADLDYCELHVTIKNYFTSLPYVDSNTGYTTRDMPYEACEYTDDMYEPKKSTLSTARVTFPSLVQRPDLRPLLQMLKEGDRVELYNLQPDSGDPVFAGNIPPGGITSDDKGSVILEFPSSLGQGQWERLRRIETFNTNASGYFTRAMSRWQDVLNEDFSTTNDPNVNRAYIVAASPAGGAQFLDGTMLALNSGTPSESDNLSITPNAPGSNTSLYLTLTPGTTLLLEVLATPTAIEQFSPGTILNSSFGLICASNSDTIAANEIIGTSNGKYNTLYGAYTTNNTGTSYFPNGYQTPNFNMFPAPRPGGLPNRYQVLMTVNADGTITMTFFVNYQMMVTQNLPAPRSTAQWGPWLGFTINSSVASMALTRWRVRRLVPWIGRAARFNPQTADTTYFQANADDYLTTLNNFAELDFSEYRPVFKAAPTLDQLELDRVGTLGNNASNLLGFDPTTHAVGTSQVAAGIDFATFDTAPSMIAPPFRLEEGYNLTKVPAINKKQLVHANDIQRMGSGSLDAQNYFETWSVPETGKPQAFTALGILAPVAPLYPYFESVTNDDRTVLPATIQHLATNDLSVATDGIPSINVSMVEQLQYAFQYRAGDNARVVTRSLLNNLDTNMRIASVRHIAGSPVRDMVLGKLNNDPTMVGLLAQDMVESWLYAQAGSSPLAIVYPGVGSIAGSSYGSDFVFPLDQYTAGTSIVSAYLHWYVAAGATVSNIQIAIAGATIDGSVVIGTLISTSASGQDSGLINVTGLFNNTGTYHMNVKNISGSAVTLSSCFLVLKVKVN